MTGEELKNELVNQIQADTLTLPADALKSAALEELIDTFLTGSLTVDGAQIQVHGNTVSIVGSLPLLSIDWQVSGSFVASSSSLTFTLTASPPDHTTVNLTQILDQYLPAAKDLPLPSLTVGTLTLTAGPDKSAAFSVDLAGQWEIPIGIAKLDIRTPNLVLTNGKSGITGTIGGTTTIAGVSLEASWELPKDFELTAGPIDLDFTSLLNDLAGAILPLPSGFPTLALTDTQVDISESDGDYTFDLQGQAGSYGSLDVEVFSGPKAAVAFALPSGWQLSNLHGLSAFSSLKFNHAGLVLSSFTDADFSFPETSMADNLQGIQEGAEFFASITLSGGALGVVGKIFQADTANIRGIIAADPSETELTASESGNLDIVPGVALSGVSLILKAAEPPSVTLQASSVINIEGDALTFNEDTTISPDDVSIALALGSPWRKPFGIGGLTIETVVLSIEVEPAFAVGIYGEIDFGKGVSVKVGAQFVDGETPDFLEAELDGTVTLTDVIDTFTSIKPPSALSHVSISNFKI